MLGLITYLVFINIIFIRTELFAMKFYLTYLTALGQPTLGQRGDGLNPFLRGDRSPVVGYYGLLIMLI